MTDLAEFLAARIAEDEEQARRQVSRVKAAADEDVYLWPRAALLIADSETTAVFVGPARVLAECEAKRRIVELHRKTLADAADDDDEHPERGCVCKVCSDWSELDPTLQYVGDWPCATLRLLALPYAGHPAFRPEWTVE